MQSIRFDFSYYNIPGWNLNSTVVYLPPNTCIANDFVLPVLAYNLVPGRRYTISYQLLNPSSNPGNPTNIFNPGNEVFYASFDSQTFATVTNLEVQGNYILQATLTDVDTGYSSSYSVALTCGQPPLTTPTPTPTPSSFIRQKNLNIDIVDTDYLNPIPDQIIDIPSATDEFPLVAIANGVVPGAKYEFEFVDTPPNSVVFENKKGQLYAGLSSQNFNSKITFSNPSGVFCYIYATVKDIVEDTIKYSQPVLFRRIVGDVCNFSLPSGINLQVNASNYRNFNPRGLTNASITKISGGKNFSIGDKLSATGGGGVGGELEIISGGITIDTFSSLSGGTGYNIGDYIEVTGGGGHDGIIQIISGGITKQSITSLNVSTGFKVGDLLTTVGGGGQGAIIRVTAVDPITGAILDYEIINSGYGYTYAPSGLVALTGNGTVSNVVFNADNFSIPAAGGITEDSIKISGGNKYNIGEILDVVGGGGTGAKVQIISGSLTSDSISSLIGGSGYSVGDLLTTTGGDGQGVVIKVKCVNGSGSIVNCPDGSPGWEIINGGYGFTGAPTGLLSLTGSGSGAAISANANNFSITPEGQITKESINGLINTGTGYSVGDKIYVQGGNGSGAIIEITAVSITGAILGYVILNGGSGYSAIPTLENSSGTAIVPQPSWTISNFTKASFIIIDQGAGYVSAPTLLVSENGDGSGATATYTIDSFTDPAFIIINAGYGYTSAPTGLSNITGDGYGVNVIFNANNFTIPPSGEITSSSIKLDGGTGYNIGEILNINGGGGEGAQIKVISGSLSNESIDRLSGGAGFRVGDLLTTTGGNGSGVVIRVKCVNSIGGIANCPDGTPGWELVNAGYGFTGAPTGLVVLTGIGNGATISANANNFSLTKADAMTNKALDLSGGSGYNIGDTINILGGDSPATAIVISGTLTNQSINSLLGGTGYSVGDLLTTTGGNGQGVVIKVKCVNGSGAISNCPDGSAGWELVNGGYGFTSAPTGLVALTGNGNGANITANADNFSLTISNGINNDALDLFGGSGYNIGDKLTITGGDSAATIQIISGGITTDTFSALSGGTGYNIGDYISVTGGNGRDGVIQIISGSLTSSSINSLIGGTGYSVGDLLTTTGGNGEGVVIRVKCVNGSGAIANCSDGSPGWEIINGGYGFTGAPTALVALTGSGSGAALSANPDNFSITAAGGITSDSIKISGGNGYNIGEILDINGGGGTGAQIQIISGSLTSSSINSLIGGTGYAVGDLLTTSGGNGQGVVIRVKCVNGSGAIANCPDGSPGWEIINGGYGFTGAPTSLVAITGSGSGANITANANNFSITAVGGITANSIKISGGNGYNIGEVLDVVGGGGTGAKIQITSGSLTSDSINSLLGGTGYAVGDLLTTTGGDGQGVVIKVKCVNGSGAITNCPDGSIGWEIVNGGYGFTGAPTGLLSLTGTGTGASIAANANNFSITPEGQITSSSITGLINTGTGYSVGDKIYVQGGNGSGAIIQITSVSNTGAILSYVILDGGSGYSSAPTLANASGTAIVPQPSWNVSNFTKSSFVIINQGSGYTSSPNLLISENGNGTGAITTYNTNNFTKPSFVIINQGSGYTTAPNVLVSSNGDGSGAVASYNVDNFTDLAFMVVNAGYGYTSAPTGLSNITGNGSGASVEFNNNNFSLIRDGGITKSSISGLIGSSNTPPFTVGSTLYITGGGGSGATILITSVDAQGRILDYIILDSGRGYDGSSAFVLKLGSVNGNIINNQPTFDVTKFTKDSFVILDSGSGFEDGNINISNITGNGYGIDKTLDVNKLTQDSFVILDQGSGFTSNNISIVTNIGNGSGAISSLNLDELTAPSFIVTNPGSGYTSSPTSITSSNGNGNGAISSFIPENFSQLAVNITNPGSGYLSAPTGVVVKTGYGQIDTLSVSFNSSNFIEISGPPPTPSVTPTITPSPSASTPAPCNSLQSAGGQNNNYQIKLTDIAVSGQNFVITKNTEGLLPRAVLLGNNIQRDTYITTIEPYKTTIDDTSDRVKAYLTRPVIGTITTSNIITLYTLDDRIIKTSYRPGYMNFSYDAYSVPDRFKIYGIPIDQTKPEILLFDSGFRGDTSCGYVANVNEISTSPLYLSGELLAHPTMDGTGSVKLLKPDGIIYIRVTVEAPCDGTAWEYLLECPIPYSPFVSSTPTTTPTRTPTPTPSNSI